MLFKNWKKKLFVQCIKKYINAVKTISIFNFNFYADSKKKSYLIINCIFNNFTQKIDFFILANPVKYFESFLEIKDFILVSEPNLLKKTIYEKSNFIYKKKKIFFFYKYYTILKYIKKFTYGFKKRLIVKGLGRRTWKTKTLIWFKLGHSFRIYLKISKNIITTVRKKRTILRFFSTNSTKLLSLCKRIIDYRPTSAYKDSGVRIAGKKRLLKFKKRRVASY